RPTVECSAKVRRRRGGTSTNGSMHFSTACRLSRPRCRSYSPVQRPSSATLGRGGKRRTTCELHLVGGRPASGDYKQSEYGRVILPLTVIRRLDCVLEPSKDGVLERHKKLVKDSVKNFGPALTKLTGRRHRALPIHRAGRTTP